MLKEIYTAVKTKILASGTSALDVQWFNMQYDATISTDNILLIEFPDPLQFPQTDNQQKRSDVRIRVHVVHRVISIQDGSIPDEQVTAHETLAEAIRTALDRFRPADSSCLTLQFLQWQHWHRQRGMMITFVDFRATKILT